MVLGIRFKESLKKVDNDDGDKNVPLYFGKILLNFLFGYFWNQDETT